LRWDDVNVNIDVVNKAGWRREKSKKKPGGY